MSYRYVDVDVKRKRERYNKDLRINKNNVMKGVNKKKKKIIKQKVE